MSAIESLAPSQLDNERRFRVAEADRLTHIGAALLRAAGALEEEVRAVTTGCVNANLTSHDSYGILLSA